MEEGNLRIIRATDSLDGLARIEARAKAAGVFDGDFQAALDQRSAALARGLIAERTGIELSGLTPAEEKIVQAVAMYVGVLKRQGKDPTRTLTQLKNHGLLEGAESAVARTKPTQGFITLQDEGRPDLSYEQIIVDHPEEFSSRALWYSKRTLGLPNELSQPPASGATVVQEKTGLLLDWLRARRGPDGRVVPFANAEAAAGLGWNDLQVYGRAYGNIQSRLDFACYRAGLPPLGLTAHAPFAAAWGSEGRPWAFPITGMQAAAQSRAWAEADFARVAQEAADLPGRALIPWREEIARNEAAIRNWAFDLAAAPPPDIDPPAHGSEQPAEEQTATSNDVALIEEPRGASYWVFVCNPRRWAIDRFLGEQIERDTWGVRPADAAKFAPGQLGIVRVGVDRRSADERDGRPPLTAGIYALCEVESEAVEGTGASDRYWAEGGGREPGWPTVRIRYLRNYLQNPLTIDRIRAEAPDVSPLLLDGFQAASFPLPEADFRQVLNLLRNPELETPAEGDDIAADDLAAAEKQYLHAAPEVKERISRTIERGSVGMLVKKARGYRCQICEALGEPALGFQKRGGGTYVEAHHVTPVSSREVGSLAASNVICVCANHHRQLHYGEVSVSFVDDFFEFFLDGVPVVVDRFRLSPAADLPD